jgi:hypothetical protein
MKKAFFFLVFDLVVIGYIFTQNAVFFTVENSVLKRYSGTEKDVVIPEDLGIIEIGDRVFANKSLTSVIIPNSVKRIGTSSFENNRNLKKIIIPSSVETIGAKAFYYCNGLSEVILSNGIINIEDNAFEQCGIVKLNIPKSITSIGNEVFLYNRSLLQIIVDKDNEIFYSDQEGVLYSKKDKQLIYYPFAKKEKTYRIQQNIESIADSAFQGNKNIEEIIMPDSLIKIGVSALMNSSISKITFSKNLQIISRNAFFGCEKIMNLTLPDSIEIIEGSSFSGCKNLINIYLSKNLKIISNTLFKDCIKLETINLPIGLEKIEHQAFYNCKSLRILTIPTSVKSIGTQFVMNCDKLEQISMSRNTKLEFNAMAGYEDRVVYVD